MTQEQQEGQDHVAEASQRLAFVQLQRRAAADSGSPDEGEGRHASSSGHGASSMGDANGGGVTLCAPSSSSGSGLGVDLGSSLGRAATKTPEPASPSGMSEDEAFSFPVTPPSEPTVPGAVFSSWQSFRKRSRKVGLPAFAAQILKA